MENTAEALKEAQVRISTESCMAASVTHIDIRATSCEYDYPRRLLR